MIMMQISPLDSTGDRKFDSPNEWWKMVDHYELYIYGKYHSDKISWWIMVNHINYSIGGFIMIHYVWKW